MGSKQQDTGKSPVMDCLQSHSLRDLVTYVNDLGIQKDSIVSLLRDEDTFFLIYYR